MRTHGWNGSAPATDEDARARILAAARTVIEVDKTELSITDVARKLGVTRQTVYRYFPSVDALLLAAALESASTGFLDRLSQRLSGITEPAEACVEGLATTLETLPVDPYISLVLTPDRPTKFHSAVTSEFAVKLCHQMLLRFDIDWQAKGFSDEELDELAEYLLRVLQSFIIDPGHPPRRGAHLRSFLRKWVSPSVQTLASQGASRT
jgi:AcrR family transcriptional regulator